MSAAVNEGSLNFYLAVPSDSTVLNAKTIKGLYVLTDGDLSLVNSSGATVVVAVLAGMILPVKPAKINAASTADVLVLQ